MHPFSRCDFCDDNSRQIVVGGICHTRFFCRCKHYLCIGNHQTQVFKICKILRRFYALNGIKADSLFCLSNVGVCRTPPRTPQTLCYLLYGDILGVCHNGYNVFAKIFWKKGQVGEGRSSLSPI